MTDWIEWKGGECPVPPGTVVEVRFRNGNSDPDSNAEWWTWDWDCDRESTRDIVAYRVVGEPPKPEETPPNAHYRQGEIECIDAIRAALTDEEWRGFCKGNVLKYVWREKHKGGNDTLVKAEDYLRWAIAGKAEGKP